VRRSAGLVRAPGASYRNPKCRGALAALLFGQFRANRVISERPLFNGTKSIRRRFVRYVPTRTGAGIRLHAKVTPFRSCSEQRRPLPSSHRGDHGLSDLHVGSQRSRDQLEPPGPGDSRATRRTRLSVGIFRSFIRTLSERRTSLLERWRRQSGPAALSSKAGAFARMARTSGPM
jgi:hypothetical protein